MLVLGGFVLFIFVTGDWLAVLTFGAIGAGTGAILAALALSVLMNGIAIVVGNGLWVMDQPRASFLADVFCLAVTLIAAALLVQPLARLAQPWQPWPAWRRRPWSERSHWCTSYVVPPWNQSLNRRTPRPGSNCRPCPAWPSKFPALKKVRTWSTPLRRRPEPSILFQ